MSIRSTFYVTGMALAGVVAATAPAHAGGAVHLGSFEQGAIVSIDVSSVQCDGQGGVVEYADADFSPTYQAGFLDGTDTTVSINSATLAYDTYYVWTYCGSLDQNGASRLPHGITLASADFTFAVIEGQVVDTTPPTVTDTTPRDTTPADTTPVDCTDTGVPPDSGVVTDTVAPTTETTTTQSTTTEAPVETNPPGPSRRPHAALCPPEVVTDTDTDAGAGSGTGQEAESAAGSELPPTGAGWSVLALLGLGLGGLGIVASRVRRRPA